MFARFGYRKTVIDEVVREAGVAKGTFYLYFKSKEELFLEVLKVIRGEMLEEWRAALEGEETARGKIRATLRFSLEAFERHPIFYKISAGDEEFRMAINLIDEEEIRLQSDELLTYFRSLFEEGIRNGELRDDINLDVIPLIFGSLKFMGFSRDLITSAGKITGEQFIDGLLDLAMNGIVAPKPAG
jgi:AcrR family transcriptional regulator